VCDKQPISTREKIEQEVAALPEPLRREVYDLARFLRFKQEDDRFDGLMLSETALAKDWSTPEEGRRMGKPVAGDVVVLPFPQTNLQAGAAVNVPRGMWAEAMKAAHSSKRS